MVFGLIGDPVAHTLSPLMHNAALAGMGVDGVYTAFRVPPALLGDAIAGMRALGISGMNVTVPHKTAVIEFLDDLTPAAREIGAVNTIINEGGILTGDNTDVYGFEMCLRIECGITTLPERVAVIGAGGAARSVVYACAKNQGVREVIVINRTVARAKALAMDMTTLTGTKCIAVPAGEPGFAETIPTCGLVVNTTSVGMHPDEDRSPVPKGLFCPGQVVCDIIYNPVETTFLRDAAASGAKTAGGLAMLAYQGARSLSLWTGKTAPAGLMLSVLRNQQC
jgi:shikimate dehydrogenase